MNVLIIENEQHAADKVKRFLQQYDPAIRILGVIDSVEGAINWLGEHTADLIFLDIELNDGPSFTIFDHISVTTPIIFTTVYDNFAIQAFKLNSVDYLLKPFDYEALTQSLDKFKAHYHNTPPDYSLLAQQMQQNHTIKDRFLAYRGDELITVKTADIAYFFARDNKVWLMTRAKEQFPISHHLDPLQEMLDPDQFFRINRQYIIHIDAIRKMSQHFKGRILVDLFPPAPEAVFVSARRAEPFKVWLGK